MSTDLQAHTAQDGQHRVGVLAEIVPILIEFGLEPNPLIESVGIDPTLLRNPESVIPMSAACRLLTAAAAATGCDYIGSLVGARGGTRSLGLVGRLMRTAPTLGDAILDLCTNQHRYIRGAVAYLIVQEDVALWGYALHGPLPDGAFHMCDGAVGIACAMLKEIVGRQPEQVLLARRPPKDDGPFRRIHEAPVRFHAEQHAVVIRRAWLSLPQPTADPALRRLLQQQVRAYWAREQPEIAERVRRLLAGRVLSHQASAAAVAQDLEMTQRTLNRRLEAHGTTFRDLLGDVRYDAACQLLATTRMPLTDIAMALGYATPSAFSRAFSGWSGISPSAWRAAQGPRTAT